MFNSKKIKYLDLEDLVERYGLKYTGFFEDFIKSATILIENNGYPKLSQPTGNIKADLESPERFHPLAVSIHRECMTKSNDLSFINEYLDAVLKVKAPSLMCAVYFVDNFPDAQTYLNKFSKNTGSNPYIWLAHNIFTNRYLANRYPHLVLDKNHKLGEEFSIPNEEYEDGAFYIESKGFDAIVEAVTYYKQDEAFDGLKSMFDITNEVESIQMFELSITEHDEKGTLTNVNFVTFAISESVSYGITEEDDFSNYAHLHDCLNVFRLFKESKLKVIGDARTQNLIKLSSVKSPTKRQKLINKLKKTQDKYVVAA